MQTVQETIRWQVATKVAGGEVERDIKSFENNRRTRQKAVNFETKKKVVQAAHKAGKMALILKRGFDDLLPYRFANQPREEMEMDATMHNATERTQEKADVDATVQNLTENLARVQEEAETLRTAVKVLEAKAEMHEILSRSSRK